MKPARQRQQRHARRYPGAAPVIDSCGVAGGVYQWQGPAAAGGDYQPTDNAVRGDLGSMLPKRESGTVWTAGEEVEVAWTHKAWHGGGYQYVHGRTRRRTHKTHPTSRRSPQTNTMVKARLGTAHAPEEGSVDD